VHDHFEEGNGGYTDVLEVMGVFLPWFRFSDGFLLALVVAIEGVSL
jgi:hypothetical protein